MGEYVIYYLLGLVVTFFIGVLITRWIFGIGEIIRSLQRQNELSLTQVRLLKKMLLNQGNSHEEIDEIIEKGNLKKNPNFFEH